MNDLVLIQSQAARQEFANRIDVLQRVKKLTLLPDDLYVTAQMAADFYEVTPGAIRKVIGLHRDELEDDNLIVLKGKAYQDYFASDAISLAKFAGFESPKVRTVTLLPRRALLRIGMLLRDSTVAKQIRTYLLNTEQAVRSEPTSELTASVTPNPTTIAETLRWVAGNTKMLLEMFPDGKNRMMAVANIYAFAGIAFPIPDEEAPDDAKKEPSLPQLALVETPAKWFSCEAMAGKIGVFTINRNPHAQLVAAVIRTFGELEPEVDWQPVSLDKGGVTDIPASRYSPRILNLVVQTLETHNWPDIARVMGRNYKIQYTNRPERGVHAVLG